MRGGENNSGNTAKGAQRFRRTGTFVLYVGAGLAMLAGGGVAAGWYFAGGRAPVAAEASQPEARAAGFSRLVRHTQPKEMPDIVFKDAQGIAHRLSEWRGKVVLVNLWATWCGPCKAELPSLDRLQSGLAGDAFAVVAVSADRTGAKEPAAFLAKANIHALALYNDDTAESVVQLKAEGLPLSVIVDARGREAARLLGPADWSGTEAASVLASFMAKP